MDNTDHIIMFSKFHDFVKITLGFWSHKERVSNKKL